MAEISSRESSEDEFSFAIPQYGQNKNALQHVYVTINKTKVKMMVDTGSTIYIIDYHTFMKLQNKAPIVLKKTKSLLHP